VRRAERLLPSIPLGAYAAEWVDGRALGAGVLVLVTAAGAHRRGPAVAAALLAVGAVASPLGVPNHHFVLGYLMLLLTLNGPFGPDAATAARWLYAALMGVAATQKALSPSFADGSFLAWLWLDGGLFGPLLQVSPVWQDIFAHNQALLAEAGPDPRVLQGPRAGLAWWGWGWSWAVIGVEAALAALALRPGRAFATCAAGFAVLLPFARQELVFASILAVLTGLAVGEGPVRRGCMVWAGVLGLGSLA
jgi:hypothetical protein